MEVLRSNKMFLKLFQVKKTYKPVFQMPILGWGGEEQTYPGTYLSVKIKKKKNK